MGFGGERRAFQYAAFHLDDIQTRLFQGEPTTSSAWPMGFRDLERGDSLLAPKTDVPGKRTTLRSQAWTSAFVLRREVIIFPMMRPKVPLSGSTLIFFLERRFHVPQCDGQDGSAFPLEMPNREGKFGQRG